MRREDGRYRRPFGALCGRDNRVETRELYSWPSDQLCYIGNTDVSNDDAMMFVLCCDHEAVWQQGQGAGASTWDTLPAASMTRSQAIGWQRNRKHHKEMCFLYSLSIQSVFSLFIIYPIQSLIINTRKKKFKFLYNFVALDKLNYFGVIWCLTWG